MPSENTLNRDLFYDTIVPFVEKLLNFFDGSPNYQIIMDSTYLKAASYIGKVSSIAESLLPLAMLLLVLRWCIALLQDVLSSELDLDILVRNFMKLIVGAIIVSNSVQLTEGIVNFGDAFLSQIMASGGGLGTVNKFFFENVIELSKKIDSDSAVTGLVGVISSLIAAYLQPLTALIIGFFLYVHGWQRSIALTQMFLYAPIAFSDCFSGGLNSGAVSYARKMLALIMEPLIVYVALKSYIYFVTHLSDFTAANTFLLPWLQFIFILATISFIRSARKFSEEIFT